MSNDFRLPDMAQTSTALPRRVTALGLLLATLCSGAAALADRPLGVDVSKWQASINWTQVYNSGRRFAFIKASQGTTVSDAWFTTNIVNASAAGMLASPYHFADPLNQRQPADSHTAVDEANYFVAIAGNYMAPGFLPPVLDVEYGSTMGTAALSTWVNSFCNRVLALKGVRPLIYTNTNYATSYLNSSVTVWDVWIANWGFTDPQTQNPPTGVWPTWKFWQYSSTGSVPGVSGDCDLDVFNGTLAQLQAYVIPGTPPTIAYAPAALTTSVQVGNNAAAQSFTIANSSVGMLTYAFEFSASWAEVTPINGTCTTETDTIAVNYTLASLNPGIYHGTITITSPFATNSPQTISLTAEVRPIAGDLDWDNDIDVNDVTLFRNCMTPPLGTQTDANCLTVDFDGDDDVDLSDYGVLQKCLTGPASPPDPNCTQ